MPNAQRAPEIQQAARTPAQRVGLRLLEEIGAIVTQSPDLHRSAQGIVETIARRMGMEVCSIYLLDREVARLRLWATYGLDPESVGKVFMGVDEGLTGIVVQKLEPVMAIDALVHPRYKYFPETGEERYHSFLGVPVVHRGEPVGVLVVQTSRRRRFTLPEVRLLKAIAVSVSGILAQVQLRDTLAVKEAERQAMQQQMDDAIARLRAFERKVGQRRPAPGEREPLRLSGLAASPGYGIGRAHLRQSSVSFTGLPRQRRLPLKRELARVKAAIDRAAEELERNKERVLANVPEIDASIFEAQRLMLFDSEFQTRIEAAIRDGLSAEAAVAEAVQQLVQRFAELDDAYLQDRAADVRDIGQLVLRHLLGQQEKFPVFGSNVIFVASEIALADLAMVQQEGLKGLVLASGGVTSHAAILARTLEIPTVVGVEGIEELIREGDHLIVDGNAGVIFVNPPVDVVREYERLTREQQALSRDLEALRDLPAETPDGRRVHLWANIGLLGDLPWLDRYGAEGVGLYRTETAFLSHRDFLSEEEQFEIYRRMVVGLAGKPLTIRTLDLGADKYPQYLHIPREDNPFLGWRSIRISLEMPDIFSQQLRAILRASAFGPVRLMFPMISSVDEICRAKEILANTQRELESQEVSFDPQIPVGIMIEVPSAVYLASHLVDKVDFVSIGTNDLIQYVLAVDRNNRKIGDLYEPLHPAVLQAIANVIHAGGTAGKQVSLCGEMASDPMCAVVLVGLGLEDLSMSPLFIPRIKRLIRALHFEDARRIAEEALRMATVKDVKGFLFEAVRDLELLDLIEAYA